MVLRILITFIFITCLISYSCRDKISEKKKADLPENENEQTEVQSNTENSESTLPPEKWKPTFNTYVNSRYEFFVKYPTNLDKQTESDNGDGREFNSSDGFNMLVYGSNDVSVFNQSLVELYNEEINSHKDVTYKVKKKNWFVVSGYDGEYIFYIKKYVGSGSSNTLELRYPSNLRDKYYDVITVISKSFKEGNIESSN